METLEDKDLQLKWEETIQKLKEYLKSLLLKKRKKIDKISKITDDEIAQTLKKEEEDDIDS
jgi:hypothetical protein